MAPDGKLRMEIPEMRIQRTTFGRIDIDELRPGETVIERLIISDFKTNIKPGPTKLKDVRVQITLTIYLDWRVRLYIAWHVPDYIPFVGCNNIEVVDYENSGRETLATLELHVPIGDVDMKLNELNFSVDETTVSNLKVDVAPITNISFPGVEAREIIALDTIMPPEGIQIVGGLGVGSSVTRDLEVSKVSSNRFKIGQISTFAVPFTLQFPEISIGARLDEARSENIIAEAEITEKCTPWVSVWPFSARICVQPKVTTKIAELEIRNLEMESEIRKTVLRNLTLPLDILGMNIMGMQVEGLAIPEMGLRSFA